MFRRGRRTIQRATPMLLFVVWQVARPATGTQLVELLTMPAEYSAPGSCLELQGFEEPRFPCDLARHNGYRAHYTLALLPEDVSSLGRRETRAFFAWRDALESNDEAVEAATRTALRGLLREKRKPLTPTQRDILAAVVVADTQQAYLQQELEYNDELDEYAGLIAELLDCQDGSIEFPPPPEPTTKDHSEALAMYRSILEMVPAHPEADRLLMMIGALLSDPNNVLETIPVDEVYTVYTEVVERYPQSPWAREAAYYAAEIDLNERRDFQSAIAMFEHAVDIERSDSIFERALYKLGWSHYCAASPDRPEQYQLALDHFWHLLTYSERLHHRTGAYSCLHDEAVTYTAMTFAEMAEPLEHGTLELALKELAKRPALESHRAILLELARVSFQKARQDDQAAVCEHLRVLYSR